jgi:hypothetical protein
MRHGAAIASSGTLEIRGVEEADVVRGSIDAWKKAGGALAR